MAGPTVRLGGGELAARAVVQGATRIEFLRAVERRVPEVLDALVRDVLPAWKVDGGAQALDGWAGWFFLKADWVQEAAETALRYYDRFPDLSSPPVWPSLDGGGCSFGSRKQRLISIEEDYLPHLERRADVEKRILKNVRARFREIEAAAQGLGPRQRALPSWHFEAAALWQCGGWDAAEIADDLGRQRREIEGHPDQDALAPIRRAVESLCKRLPLPHRHGHPGKRPLIR